MRSAEWRCREQPMDERYEEIRRQVLERMDLSHELSDEEIQDLIAEIVANVLRGQKVPMRERGDLQKRVFHSLRKLDVLQDLVDDPSVTEIMVNGPRHIFYERDGHVYESPLQFSSEEKLQDVIQQIVGQHNRVVNQASPIVDTRLPDGSRVNIVLAPVSLDGAAVTIRKFPEKPYLLEDLIAIGSLSREVADFLKLLVQAKYSLFISGGTGSGKTTFLNALSQHIPSNERIVTIEDSAELQIQGIPNLVRMETRNSNVEGLAAITIRDLIRTALRMRPDRIIVGECRGAETFDMLQAMNTGHDGSLSTGHGNSCRDMIARLEMMVLMGMELPLSSIRQQIVSGIDVMVYLGRLKDGSRKVLEVVELDGIQDGEPKLNVLYRFRETGTDPHGRVQGCWEQVGQLVHQEKLAAAGLEEKT